MSQDTSRDDSVQHGIDGNDGDDGKTALGLGAVGGGTVGAIAGSVLGPLGTLVGAAIGGTIGSLASGAAVDAVDAVDNDDTVSGVGSGVHHKGELTRDSNDLSTDYSTVGTGGTSYASGTGVGAGGHNVVTGDEAHTDAGKGGLATGAVVGGLIGTAVAGPVGAVVGGTLGSLAGGVAGDASEVADDTSTRGTSTTGYGTSMNTPGNNTPGVQTGGTTTAGADTRGITEKIADTVTGNPVDDKTGGVATGVMGTGIGSTTTGYYGEYQGRHITRDEYNALPESDRMKVRLLEETLNVGKESRQAGEVEISKRIVEEQVSVPVTLEREEIVIHRHAATGSTDATGQVIGADSQTIVVPVREEFANVTKDVRVSEEIEIEKRTISEQKTVTDTVRREEVDIEGVTGKNVRIDDTTGRTN